MSTDSRLSDKSGSDINNIVSDDVISANDAQMQVFLKDVENGEVTPAEMLKKALQQIEAEENDWAIDLLYLYLDEAVGCGGRLIAIHQDVRFKLASLLFADDRFDEAAMVLEEYLKAPVRERDEEARKMLEECALIMRPIPDR